MAIRRYRRILVPVDGSATAAAAAREAVRIAADDARLRLIYVMDERLAVPGIGSAPVNSGAIYGSLENAGELILEEVRAIVDRTASDVEAEIVPGGASGVANAIVRDARGWGADAIVMGTHGRTGVRRLLMGSVAEGVLRRSNRPLLLVPRAHRRSRAAPAARRGPKARRRKPRPH